MSNMNKSELIEFAPVQQRLTEGVSKRAVLCEDVEQFGLDPDVYLAVIEAELGKAGIVNRNRRVYQVDEFVRQNELLIQRVAEEFVDGELGHPDGGPTFDVPARLISVEVKEDGNTATSSGRFGILATTSGRDVLTLFRAGMGVGTSSRGSGVVEEMVLEEGGPYSDANSELIGETVFLVKEFHLDTYDLVRVPSAGTHLLSEAGSKESTPEGTVEMTEANEVEVIETAEEVKEEAQVIENPILDPLADLNENQKAVLLKIVEAVSMDEAPSDNRLAKEVAALREQVECDRQRTVVNEAEYVQLKEELASLKEEREARKVQDEVAAKVDECVEGRRFGGLVRDRLVALSEQGLITSACQVTAHGENLFSMIEGSHTPIAAPVVAEPVDAQDDLVEEAVAEAHEAPVLPVDIHEQLLHILKKDRG
tara:strand:+ start:162 stop:1433 length:1272 start_codon:yes stop_codon:yes gene_type:complete